MESLKDISKSIFLKNAMLRGEGLTGGKKKKAKGTKMAKKAPAKKRAKKSGGIVIGGQKKRKLPAGASDWIDFVRKVYNKTGLSWKDSLVAASKLYKK